MGKSYCCLEVINCFCVKHPKREQNYEKIGHICLVSIGNIQIENMVFAVRIVGYVQTSTAFAFYVWTFPLETMQIYPISLWDYSLFGSFTTK